MRALLILGGLSEKVFLSIQQRLKKESFDWLGAVDQGIYWAQKLGYTLDLALGDLDSLHPLDRAEVLAHQVNIERYPAAKDDSDGALLLEGALRAGATELLILCAMGLNRPDHFLSLTQLLAKKQVDMASQGRNLRIELYDGQSQVHYLLGPCQFDAQHKVQDPEHPEQAVVSIIPWSEELQGLDYQGLAWPLEQACVSRGTSKTLSNYPLQANGHFRVQLAAGQALLCLCYEKTPERIIFE